MGYLMARKWWQLVLVIVAVGSLVCSNSALSDAEVAALLDINAKWGINATWNVVFGTDPCLNWAGVKCDSLGNHVTYLNITTLGVVGDVPDSISKLTFLEHFDASNWDPQKFGNLPGWNRVSGDLGPFANLTSLKSFNVSWNLDLIAGVGVPDAVFNLINLTELRIDNCYLKGPLSSRIGNLRQLQIFYAGNNTMSGDIPKEIGSLTNLREMTLWLNSWKSQIPTEFGNLVNLEYLNIRDSGLWGGLPSEMGALTRLQRLHAYNNLLTGRIPDTWQNMKRIKELRLSMNYLSGDIPPWIWTFQNLSNVQLQENRFTGSYPGNFSASVKTLTLQCNFLTGNTLPGRPANLMGDSWDVDDNCFSPKVRRIENKCLTRTPCDVYLSSIANNACPPCPVDQESYNSTLCTCRPTDPEKNSNLRHILAGVLGGGFGALAIAVFIYFILWKRKKDKAKQADASFDPELLADTADPNWQPPPGVQRFKLSELSKATDGFAKTHEIGVGGFGKVFVGTFKDGKMMAIKRASGSFTSNQGLAEFRNEVMLLSRLHHRNLVRLEGFCDESELQILVYEYMSQGNLHAHLFKSNESSKSLNWYSRLEIAVGVANGLNYLHTFADPPVIHRDVKPSNILLDDNLIAKVADFGISKATEEFITHVSTGPAGTPGYCDPQYYMRRQLTTASDVYSYGVVLLELVTGERALDCARVDSPNLVEWARPKFNSGGIEAIVDLKLGESYPKDIYTDMAEIALACALLDKDDRPTMKDVLNVLEPHFHSCRAPLSNKGYSSVWESTDLMSAPSFTDPSFTGMTNSFTNVSSSNSHVLENTRSTLTTSQLLR